MSEPRGDDPAALDPVDYEDLYQHAPCGYLSMRADDSIFQANATLANWTGYSVADLTTKRFPQLLTAGTRIFYETHGVPSLRLRGQIGEMALEIRTASGDRIAIFANFATHIDAAGQSSTRLTLFKAVERRRWESELVEARKLADRLLQAELENTRLREQFIAVLGHDLRNPIAAIAAGMSLLKRREQLGPKGLQVVDLVEGSVGRMSALIEDVLDLARGRLDSGTALGIRGQVDLEPMLRHLVGELDVSSPGRVIETRIDIPLKVACDPSRIGQLVSNLLGNALTHGSSDAPVRLTAKTEADTLVLEVINSGTPIPPAAMEQLFQPFVRGQARADQKGLGLGLYIACEIAKAHGGTLDVASSPQETRFTFRMPINHSPAV